MSPHASASHLRIYALSRYETINVDGFFFVFSFLPVLTVSGQRRRTANGL